MSRFERSETVRTRAAPRAARGTTTRKTRRWRRLISVASRSNERSWIVTTAGHGARTGRAYCVWTSAAPAARSARGQRPRHPQLLAPEAELDRLDARRDEIRPTRDGADPKARRRRERRQLAQQVEHVRLVARPAATEDVGVDDDERGAHASSRQRPRRSSADALPREGRGALEPERDELVAAALRLGDAGRDRLGTRSASTSTAAPPATSSVAPPPLVTTGVPQAIASRIGSPKPS